MEKETSQLIGQELGDRYLIEALLGKQTGRRTFLAKDSQMNQLVVLKLILFGPDFTWEDLKLFEREAKTLKSLDHPAIPKYLDSFEVETLIGKGFVLVQTYIEARSLKEWANSGRRFSEPALVQMAEALLRILDYLHSQVPAVVHRDIKPSNILLSESSTESEDNTEGVYLVDFGSVQTVAHSGTMTVVGTYGYMPPEQFGGRSLPASDIYSLGATLIYLASGKHPADLTGDDFQLAFSDYVTVSPALTQWLTQLTYADLARRTASAAEAFQQLSDCQLEEKTVEAAGLSEIQRLVPPGELAPALRHEDFSALYKDDSLSIKFSRYRVRQALSGNQIKWGRVRHVCYTIFALVFVLGLSADLYVGAAGFFIGILFLSPSLYLLLAMVDLAIAGRIPEGKVSLSLDKMPNGIPLLSLVSLPGAEMHGRHFEEEFGTATEFTHMPVRLLSVSKRFFDHQLSLVLGRKTKQGDRTLNITGSRRDIQWLCAQISQWSDLPINHGKGWP